MLCPSRPSSFLFHKYVPNILRLRPCRWPLYFGLLVVECIFSISLLKFVLVRWCLDAVSMSRILQLSVIWGADVVRFSAQNVSFGIFVASTLTPWETIERSGGTSEHKKGDLGVQAWISIHFGIVF